MATAQQHGLANTVVDTNGNVGFGTGTTTLLAPLQVGSGAANNSTDAVILIARDVDDTGAGAGVAGHAFSDSSDITRGVGGGAGIGYNSFDARIDVSGTANYDHFAAFQTGPNLDTSGTIGKYYGLFYVATVGAGTVTDAYGVFIKNITGAGAVTNNYGIYVAPLSKGGTRNFAVYTEGTTASHFEGNIETDALVTFTGDASIAAKSLGHHSSNYVFLTGGTAGLKLFDDGAANGITVQNGGAIELGDGTNQTQVSATGNLDFVGSAGFYPRLISQANVPAAGTGATQLDTSELAMWIDTDDSTLRLVFNQAGTVKTIQLT